MAEVLLNNGIVNGGIIPVIYKDILSKKPASAATGALFISTDQTPNIIQQYTGTAWVTIITGSGGGGTLTGAINGLDVVGANALLGGDLTKDTEVIIDGFGLTISDSNAEATQASIAITSGSLIEMFVQDSSGQPVGDFNIDKNEINLSVTDAAGDSAEIVLGLSELQISAVNELTGSSSVVLTAAITMTAGNTNVSEIVIEDANITNTANDIINDTSIFQISYLSNTDDTAFVQADVDGNLQNVSIAAANAGFQDVAEQAIPGGNVTWSAVTQPAGTATYNYQWLRIGHLVTVRFNLLNSLPGANVSALNIVFPSDLPAPSFPTGTSSAASCYFGTAVASVNTAYGTAPQPAINSSVWWDSVAGKFNSYTQFNSGAWGCSFITLTYFANVLK